MTRLAPALAVLLLGSPAHAGDFLDTTITFIAGDDNAFADAGATIPSSPRPDFRPRAANSLFYDNYDQRNTGEETRTHLVLYKEFDGYWDTVVPEAALVLEWDLNRSSRDIDSFEESGGRRTFAGIRDDGSYLALHFVTDGTYGEDSMEKVAIVLFPFDSDRFRLGYSWELTYGGRSSFILAKEVPALRVSYEARRWYAFGGAKMARTQAFTQEPNDPSANENETVYALLGGFGVDVGEHFIIEANAGYFEKGDIPIERGELLGTNIDQIGGTLQLTWHDGLRPTRSVDTRLYRNVGHHELRERDWQSKALGWLVSTEATVTSQVLEQAEALGETEREIGYAGDVNAVVETGHWRFTADVVLRSLEFLVQDTPGLFPFSTIPDALETTPEWFFALGAEVRVPSLRLVPGVSLGVQQPAVAKVTDSESGFDSNVLVRKTKNVLGQTSIIPTALPLGEDVVPVYAGRLNLKSHLSDMFSLIGELQVSFDQNLVSIDPERDNVRTFDNPWVLGFAFIGQARF